MLSAIVERAPRKMFTEKEDELLKELVSKNGLYNWEKVAEAMKTRNARQCKERYLYYLDPTINNEPFTFDEDLMLLTLVREKGTRWSSLTERFVKRTQYALKNRWMYLQRIIKKHCDNVPLQKAVEIIHELPQPKPKAKPLLPPKEITKYEKIIILRPDKFTKENIMEILPIDVEPPKQPNQIQSPKQINQIQKVESMEIIPIEPPKQPVEEEIHQELDIEPDNTMNPVEEFRVFSESDFDDFFK